MSAADFVAVLFIAFMAVLWVVVICAVLALLALTLVYGSKRNDGRDE